MADFTKGPLTPPAPAGHCAQSSNIIDDDVIDDDVLADSVIDGLTLRPCFHVGASQMGTVASYAHGRGVRS